jgi:lysophospholipase L1-like esterase
VFIDRVTFNGTAVRIEQEGRRVLVYGDSLAVGGNVDHVSTESWPVLLREHFPTRVEAYGYRALYEDASTAEARVGLAAKITSWAPDTIWLAIGANDYAFKLWSARQFGEAYAATLDAIHSSSPQAILYAQSPIRRANEGPNSLGDSLDNYRQQINAACLARSPWCIFVDGTASAFPQLDELAEDGIHLTTKSSVKYAEAVLEFIGK